MSMYAAAHVGGQQELELALNILVSSCNSSAVQLAYGRCRIETRHRYPVRHILLLEG